MTNEGSEFDEGYKVVSGRKRIATAAPNNLFKFDEDAVKLDQARAKEFHNITERGVYVTKRARPNISLAIAFLTIESRDLTLTIGGSFIIWLSISGVLGTYH